MFRLLRIEDKKKLRLWLHNHKIIIGECWTYSGSNNSDGYGTLGINGKTYYVHRLSAYIYLGLDLDSNLQINHKNICKFKSCWNPEHIYIGTQGDNIRDVIESGVHHFSPTGFCRKGIHLLAGSNLNLSKLQKKGILECRICMNERENKRQKLKRKRNEKQK